MPRLLEAKKDVISCEKPGLGANDRLNPGYPNGATRQAEGLTSAKRRRTWGTETSKYPQEEKIIMIPQVVASERGRAQTNIV